MENARRYRVSISNETLTLVPWEPHLATTGPFAAVIGRADGTVADLSVCAGMDGDREVVVSYLRRGEEHLRDEARLVKWAEDVGYRRAWLPNALVDLPGIPASGDAEVTCPSCSTAWENGSPAFWLAVAFHGGFPYLCNVCGTTLPQWDVSEESSRHAHTEADARRIVLNPTAEGDP